MKIFIVTILMLLIMAMGLYAMTVDEFAKIKSGDIVHLKLEWNGKIYLEGDVVVCFKIDQAAQIASTNPKDNFSGMFNYVYLTLVGANNTDTSILIQENMALKAKIARLLKAITDLLKMVNE